MPSRNKYDQEFQERAVHMHVDQLGKGDISKRGAGIEVGKLLGMNEATLRNWVRAEVGEGTSATTD